MDAPVDSTIGAADAPDDAMPHATAAESPGVERVRSWRRQFSAAALSPGRVRALALGLAALLVVVGWWWWQGRPRSVALPPEVVAEGTATTGGSAMAPARPGDRAGGGAELIVQVSGPVRHPGIVTVPAGARVIDAIEAAGGLRRGADFGSVNLARPVIDGEQIIVGDTAGSGAATGAPARLSLNQASAAQLEELPGVGPVLAGRIIQWREAHGGFRSLDELREVSGIGDATFADLSPMLTAP